METNVCLAAGVRIGLHGVEVIRERTGRKHVFPGSDRKREIHDDDVAIRHSLLEQMTPKILGRPGRVRIGQDRVQTIVQDEDVPARPFRGLIGGGLSPGRIG